VRRSALISLLLVLALALVATGGGASTQSDDDDDDPQAASIASGSLIAQFRNAPGQAALREVARPDASWEQLGLGLNTTPAQQKRYGTFTIYVVEPGRTQTVTSLLSDKDTAKPLERAARGIYWDFGEAARTYVAYKLYGENVVLAWWNEKRKPVTDSRIDRLGDMLTSLAPS
jgi:endonuclease YncB( thermonuclease family)